MAHYQIPNGTAFCTIVRTVSLSNVTVSPCEKGCCELCCKNLVRELPSVAYLRTGRPNFDCAPMFLQKMKSHNARFTCLWSLRISGHLHRLLANVQPMLPFNITNGCAVPASFATRSVLIYSFQLVVSWIGRKTGRRWGTIPKEHGQCGWEKAPVIIPNIRSSSPVDWRTAAWTTQAHRVRWWSATRDVRQTA